MKTERLGPALNVVWAIEQTEDDMLWVGTLNGLAHFDSHSFTTFTAADTDGLAGNRILGLYEDREGTLWIGTTTGVSTYRNGTSRTVDGISSQIDNFDGGPAGTVWMAVKTGVFRAQAGGKIYTTHLAPSGTLWLTTRRSGLLRITDGGVQRVQVAGSPENRLRGLTRDEHGLFRQRDNRFAAVQTPEGESFSSVSALECDSTGTLWIASRQQGLYRDRSDTLRRVLPSDRLFNSRVMELIRAQNGTLWIGTQQRGVATWAHGMLTWYDGVPYKSVRDIDQTDDGTIWISTSGGGIARFEGGILRP